MDLTICKTCGTQYSSGAESSCKICDDPRQYVPPDGQQWTTLGSLRQSKKYHNEFSTPEDHSGMVSIVTVPQVGIGQRAILCCTAKGNVLWDCITYIDDDTISRINDLGGLDAIAISHPHYFSTAVEWAQAFSCPVYYSAEDEEWIMRYGKHVQRDVSLEAGNVGAQQILWRGSELDLLGGEATVVKTGGHFPGSSVLFWKEPRKLMVADTIFIVPSGLYHVGRPPGTVSFTFMWSYPNLIPLPPDDVHRIWKAVSALDFDDTHGAFMGRNTYGDSKRRLLESAKLYVKHMGYVDHAIHKETL